MKEINEQIIERYMLSIERIRRITEEETTEVLYRDYFRKVSEFILKINEIRERMQDKPFEQCTLDELKRENESIYADVVGDQYDTSYANPAYAVSLFGEEIGQLLSFLYTELRGEIAYVYEQQVEYLAICNELFIDIYNCCEGTLTPDYKELKEIAGPDVISALIGGVTEPAVYGVLLKFKKPMVIVCLVNGIGAVPYTHLTPQTSAQAFLASTRYL